MYITSMLIRLPEIKFRIDVLKITTEVLKKACKSLIGKPVMHEGKKVGEVTDAYFIEDHIEITATANIKIPLGEKSG